jgi:hypothetical protein
LAAEKDTKTPILALKKNEALRFDATVGGFSSDGLCCWPAGLLLLLSALCAARCWLLAAGCWLLAAGCWLLAAGC